MHTHGFSLEYTAYPGKLIVNELTDEKLWNFQGYSFSIWSTLYFISWIGNIAGEP